MEVRGPAPVNALLNGHCKEGEPLRAFALLMEMCGDERGCPPDRISFGIVLTALLRAGETAAAWQTYKRMERAGFEADGRALDTLARGLCRRCATDVSALGDVGRCSRTWRRPGTSRCRTRTA